MAFKIHVYKGSKCNKFFILLELPIKEHDSRIWSHIEPSLVYCLFMVPKAIRIKEKSIISYYQIKFSLWNVCFEFWYYWIPNNFTVWYDLNATLGSWMIWTPHNALMSNINLSTDGWDELIQYYWIFQLQ